MLSNEEINKLERHTMDSRVRESPRHLRQSLVKLFAHARETNALLTIKDMEIVELSKKRLTRTKK